MSQQHSSSADLTFFQEVFIEQLDTLLDQAVFTKTYPVILSYITEVYLVERIHRFFIPANLVRITQDLFENEVVRDFFLELSDRLSLLLMLSDFSLPVALSSFCDALMYTHQSDCDNVLVPKPIAIAIEITDSSELLELLRDNLWLVCLLLTKLFLAHSSHWKNAATTLIESN